MRLSNGDDAGNSSKAHEASPKRGGANRPTIASEVQAVRKLFTEAQRTVQCHRRCCDALRRLLSKHKSAWDEYLACLSRILVVSKRDPGVERLVQFVILLAASGVGGDGDAGGAQPRGGVPDDERAGAVLDRTVEFLLTRSAAADKAVRFRCCQLLGGMMAEYSQRLHVQEEEFERVVDVLLPRLQDKVAGVRVQAVAALRPFQFGLEEDEDEDAFQEDRVRAELMRAMMSDSSPDVRQAALVAVNKAVGMLDQLVLRTQDVKDSVRKAAFHSLGEHVPSKNLLPQQRVTLVKMGLSDGSEAVVEACRFMICAHWFREVDYDPVQLLGSLAVIGNEKVPEQVVREIVRLGLRADRERGDPSLGMGLTLDDAKALRKAAGRRVSLPSSSSSSSGEPGEAEEGGAGGGGQFSPEEALYVRIQAEVVKEDKEISAVEKETRLEAILPDTMSLCDQIEVKSKELKVLEQNIEAAEEEADAGVLYGVLESEVFVLQQLLKLAAHADSSEEAGRRRLVNLLQALLVDTNTLHQLVESIMEALAAAHPSDADFVRVVAELVSDISDLVHSRPAGGEASVQNASLNGSLNASFASVLGGLGGVEGATPSRSFSIMRSAVRAAIPKNFVKDRARAIEGIPAMAGDILLEGGGGDGKEKEKGVSGEQTVSSEDDEFMDAVSHHSNSNSGDEGNSEEGVRQLAGGGGVGGDAGLDAGEVELDIRRMFRILDMLSVLLTTTRQTLAKDATLTAFEDVLKDSLTWATDVLPTLAPDMGSFGPELRKLAVRALGKYSLLGESAAIRNRPMLLEIALCEDETGDVRICAMQALSDLSLIFRGAVFGSTGDLLSMFADILKDRAANRAMVAVAAEAVSRLLFFGLAQDPDLLARLFVLYFEKGSAADPSAERRGTEGRGGEGGEEEEGDGDEDGDAKEVGSSVRLSQILGVYFRSLPSAPTRVRDMLFESMRRALHVLREIAELNVAAKKNNEDEQNTEIGLIDVPAQAVVKFVLELLMRHEEGAASAPAPVEKPSPSSPSSATTTTTSSIPPASSPSAGGTDTSASEEGGDEEMAKGQAGQQADLESNSGQEKSSSSENGVDNYKEKEKAATDATAHAALCITEELWTLSGIDGLSDLVLALAKVLASLPLPQDDQATVKRLRYNVDRLEALGDGRLGAKVSRIIAKYAEVLLAADLTPHEGVGSDGDGDEDDDEHDSVAEGKDGSVVNEEQEEVEGGKEAKEVPKRKKRTRASPPTIKQGPPPPPAAASRRPARKSKVEARAKMADAEAKAAAAAAIDEASSSSSSDEEEEEEEEEGVDDDADGDGGATVENDSGGSGEQEENGGSASSSAESDCSAVTVVKATRARAKATPRRTPRRRSSRVAPLSEIGNSSPVPN